MKKSILLLFVILFALVAFAQDTPKVEVFGGYQYTNVDFKGGIDRQNFNGWDADVAFKLHKNISLVADISGAYKTLDVSSIVTPFGAKPAVVRPQAVLPTDVKVTAYNYLFGPRFSFGSEKVSPFVEALFGAGHITFKEDIGGVTGSVSSNGYAMALGGGIDYNASKRFGIRIVKFDYLLNHVSADISGLSASENLNNYRIATGVVFKF